MVDQLTVLPCETLLLILNYCLSVLSRSALICKRLHSLIGTAIERPLRELDFSEIPDDSCVTRICVTGTMTVYGNCTSVELDVALAKLAALLPSTCIRTLAVKRNIDWQCKTQREQIPTNCITALTNILFYSDISSLDLSGINFGKKGLDALATALGASTNITRLTINYLQHFDMMQKEGGLDCLFASLPTSLRSLELNHNNIQDDGLDALATATNVNFCVRASNNITRLVAIGNSIGAFGATALAAVLHLTRIVELDLSGNNISNQGAAAIAAALQRSPVTRLDLGSNNIGVPGAAAIAAALGTSNITRLNLMHSKIGDEGTAAIAAALGTSSITSLDLGYNQVGPPGAAELALFLPFTGIVELDLTGNSIGDKGIGALAAALQYSTVITLSAKHNHINDKGIEALAAVLQYSSITDLNLSWNKISRTGAAALAGVLGTSLISLKLHSNAINDGGAAAIAAALPESCVETLNLQCNVIGDAGATALLGVLPASHIKEIHIGGNISINEDIRNAIHAHNK